MTNEVATSRTVADALASAARGIDGVDEAYVHASNSTAAILAIALSSGQRFSVRVEEVQA